MLSPSQSPSASKHYRLIKKDKFWKFIKHGNGNGNGNGIHVFRVEVVGQIIMAMSPTNLISAFGLKKILRFQSNEVLRGGRCKVIVLYNKGIKMQEKNVYKYSSSIYLYMHFYFIAYDYFNHQQQPNKKIKIKIVTLHAMPPVDKPFCNPYSFTRFKFHFFPHGMSKIFSIFCDLILR